MKPFFYALPLWLLLASACGGSSAPAPTVDSTRATASATPFDTVRTVVQRARQQSRLYTTECKVHKLVLYSDDTKVGGQLLNFSLPGYRKLAVPIDVTLKAYIDFSRFTTQDVVARQGLIVITLPDPRIIVTASKIDRQAVRQYISQLRSKFDDAEIQQFARQGQDSIVRHIPAYGLVETAKESATRVLLPLMRQIGFPESSVIIRFRKDFNERDIQRMVEPFQLN